MHRKFIKALGLVFLSTLLFTSCGSQTSNTTFKFVNGAFNITALSENFNGGALIIGRNKLGPEKFQLAISPDNTQEITTELPFGDYEIMAIGWHNGALTPGVAGPGMEGTTYCDLVHTQIGSDSTAVTLSLSGTKCANEPFLSSIYSDSPSSRLNIEFCHGIVQHPNEGRRKDCKESVGVANSYEIEYLSLDADGLPIPGLTLKSACIDNASYQDAFSTANRKPFINYQTLKFNSPTRIRSYVGTGCTDIDNSYSVVFPKSLAHSTSNFATFYKDAPQDVDFPVTGSNLLVGADSCSVPIASSGPNVIGTWDASGQNVICTTAQFNTIPNNDTSTIVIGRTIDFLGANPTPFDSGVTFKGKIIGDYTIKMNNLPHFKGMTASLFSGFGAAGVDASIRDVNINVSSIINGPILAKEAFGNIGIEQIKVVGEMTNNTSNDLTLVASLTYSSGCGGFFNTYNPGTTGQRLEFENLKFENFKLNCEGITPNYDLSIGGLIGSIHSENTADTDLVEIRIERINGDITIANTLEPANSLSGFIGLVSKGVNFKLHGSDINFNYTGNNTKNIGGFIGKIANGTNNEYGYFRLNDSSANVSINSTKAIAAQEGVGSLIGWAYNSASLELHNVHADGAIISKHKNAGGLIGYAGNYEYDNASQYFELSIRNSINSTDVTGGQFVGGIIGATDSNFATPSQRQSLTLESSVNKGYVKSLGKVSGVNLVASGGSIGCVGCTSNEVGKIRIHNFLNLGTSKTYLESASEKAGASPFIGIAFHTEDLTPAEASYEITDSQYIFKSFIDTDSTSGSETFLQADSAIEYIDNSITQSADASVYHFNNIVCPHCNDSTVLTNILTTSPLQTLDNSNAEIDNSYITDFSTNDFFNASGDLILKQLMDNFYSEGIAIGTRSKPFKLSQSSNLELLANNPVAPNLSWKMISDINMNSQHLQLSPLDQEFRGSFDGNGYTISNFTNNYASYFASNLGIFSKVTSGEIRNLNIKQGSMNFACDGFGFAGLLIGTLDVSNMNSNGGNDRPMIHNISIDSNTITNGTQCDTGTLFIGNYTTQSEFNAFENVSITNNTIDTSNALVSGNLIGVMYNNSAASLNFNFKNLQLINNSFQTPGSNTYGFIASNGGANSFNLIYENVLYIGPTDVTLNPSAIHKEAGGTSSFIKNNYLFIESAGYTNTASINNAILSNSGAYNLSDMFTFSYDKYFNVNQTAGTISLNRALIAEDIKDR